MKEARQNRASGFTLMELLVVLAIIAILAGLIIPNVQRSREQARITHCRNNLHQFLVALNQFFEDQGENYVAFYGWGAWQKSGESVYTLDQDGKFTWRPEETYTYSSTLTEEEQRAYQEKFGDYKNVLGSFTMWTMVDQYIGGSAASPEATVAFCPATYKTLDVFNTNSPNFKGLRYDPIWGYTRDWGISTYGITTNQAFYRRQNIKGDKIAFSDWNHKLGWNCRVGYETNLWAFTNPKLGAYQDSSKGRPGCLTEVGFHHAGANGEMGANVAFFDGRVEWLSTNVITNLYLWK